MSSRAVLLPAIGDPYQMSMWFHNYDSYSNYVDKLYVSVDSLIDKEIIGFLEQETLKRNGDFFYRGAFDHGRNISFLLEQCKEDNVFLTEEDVLVLEPEIINRYFSIVEQQQKIVGTTRVSSSAEIFQRSLEVFKLEGKNFSLTNLWPCLLFIKRDYLLDTDRNFSAKNWQTNEYIPELNWTCPSNQAMDTFGWASIQLRAKNKYDFLIISDCRCGTDHKNYKSLYQWPFIHFGGASASMIALLADNNNKFLGYRQVKDTNNTPQIPPDEHIREDFSRMIAWWTICFEQFQLQNEVSYFNQIYKDALDRCVRESNLNINAINLFKNLYMKVVS
jgi:hypothetical protein